MTGDTVVVNGQKLTDKGAIIDGKANVPVRGISEVLGADIKVDGKTIIVTTESENNQTPIEPTVSQNNNYKEFTKQQLESNLANLNDNILAPTVQTVTEIESNIQKLKMMTKSIDCSWEKAVAQERDINKVSPWAAAAWDVAKKEGLFDGSRPGDPLIREEAAIVFFRLEKSILQKLNK
ncbi:stalk domain-containing protein [Paenibacillus lautus]|uniref:stalk domain-containing protein n=1 Tax=Paenibacillus lautus TaxID=1401 RepID=UPI003D9AA1BA